MTLFLTFSRHLFAQGYLKSNGCYEALSSLALEADASYDELPDDLLYLQRLVLQGRYVSGVCAVIVAVCSDNFPGLQQVGCCCEILAHVTNRSRGARDTR